MNNMNLFSLALIAFGLASAGLAVFSLIKIKESNLATIEKIPRNFLLGVIFGAAAVTWCVPQAIAIFSVQMSSTIYIVAVVVFFVGIFFLDYLFARAFAGFIILLSHYFLAESFAADIHLMSLFSSLCIIMGIFGIIIGALPHLLRDILRKMCVNAAWKTGISIVMSIYAMLGLITGITLLF